MGIERMLRMYLLQIWFNLSDPATEDAIYDRYTMRKFIGIDFMTEYVPDGTTRCKFRHLLEEHGINKLFFDAINRVNVNERRAGKVCKVHELPGSERNSGLLERRHTSSV